MSIVGAFWGVGQGRASGWVCDTSSDQDLLVTLLADGRECGSAWARRRLAVAGLPDGARDFDVSAAMIALGDAAFQLQACCGGKVFAAAHHITGAEPAFGRVGAVDEIGNFKLGGWALDLGRRDRPITIDVCLGALWIGAFQTVIPRPDIQARFGVSQPCGFNYVIPAPLRCENLGAIRLFIANTDVELKGSPVMVG